MYNGIIGDKMIFNGHNYELSDQNSRFRYWLEIETGDHYHYEYNQETKEQSLGKLFFNKSIDDTAKMIELSENYLSKLEQYSKYNVTNSDLNKIIVQIRNNIHLRRIKY